VTEPLRVLFVDDEENILRALRRLFRREPWELAFAGSGAEALARGQAEGPFDVVVTDQRMPGMTGVELLQEVRRRWPQAVRLILSGYTDVQAVLDAVNQGAIYKFLTKPWDDDVLRQAVREAVEVVRLRRENERLQETVRAQRDELEAINRSLTEGARSDLLARLVLDGLPVGVAVFGENGALALANREGHRLLRTDDRPGNARRPGLEARDRAALRMGPSAPVALFSWKGTAYVLWEER
jgi:DNA-binding NtrC family response regulator